uniref:Uncharacterized protein n=1 Tax=Oryza sativa subsp. japonica TaxID=39947 RepID=Q654A9_ORYSJ|nr:hypothetical protein [Oryza sativa Japonica Group]
MAKSLPRPVWEVTVVANLGRGKEGEGGERRWSMAVQRGEKQGKHGAGGVEEKKTAPALLCDWSASAARPRGGSAAFGRRRR